MTTTPPPPTEIPPAESAGAGCARPASVTALMLAFNRLAMQGFGGVLPIAQHELVERQRWLTREEFVEMLSVAQVLPGPNIVNLALMIGDRFFGLRGAAAALAGMLVLPLVLVLLITALYAQFARHPMVAGALRGMGAVAAGLIIATGLKLFGTLRRSVLGLPACVALAAATFGAVAVLRLPLVGVLAVLGPVGMALAWWRLGIEARRTARGARDESDGRGERDGHDGRSERGGDGA